MSDKKKHHSFRVSLPAREVMRRLQLYVANSQSTTLEIHTVDIAGYDLTFKNTRISFREDADTEDTIVFVEQDGTESNAYIATELEHYLDDEKYYQFRVPISVEMVMQYVRAKYNHSQFSEMFTGSYDFILNQRRVALIPDNDHNGTTVLIERNDDFAAELEYLLHGNKHLQNPIHLSRGNKWLMRLTGGSVSEVQLAVLPNKVFETLLNLSYPNYHLRLMYSDQIGSYRLNVTSIPNEVQAKIYPDIEVIIHIQIDKITKQTQVIAHRLPSGSLSLAFLAIVLTLLSLIDIDGGGLLLLPCLIPLSALFLVDEFRTYFMRRSFDNWLQTTLQNLQYETEHASQEKTHDMHLSDANEQVLKHSARKKLS